MSLINDALQDLESRKSHNQARQNQQEKMDGSTRQDVDVALAGPATFSSERYFFRFIPILLVAGVCLTAGYWYAGGLHKPPESASESISEPVLSETLVAVASVKPMTVSSRIRQENTSSPSIEAVENYVGQNSLDESAVSEHNREREESEEKALTSEYLNLAQQAVALNRLTLPEGRSALFFFQKVLSAENANQQMLDQAKAGIEQLQRKYLAQLDRAIASNNRSTATSLYSRLNILNLPERVVDSYAVRMDSLLSRLESGQQSPLVSTAERTIHNDDYVRFETIGSVKTLKASQGKESLASNHSEGHFDLQLTLDTRDAKVAREATALLKDGNKVMALNVLQQFAKQNPAAFKSNVLLTEIYLEQGDYSRAQQVISALTADHAAFAYLNALLSNAVHGSEYAIAVLEQHQPGERIEKKHLSLLAGLYQKQKQSEKAWLTYQLLVQKHPADVRILLGYAVSSDTLNKKEQAFRAYSSLKSIGHPDPSVQNFIKQRISALKPDVVVEVSQW